MALFCFYVLLQMQIGGKNGGRSGKGAIQSQESENWQSEQGYDQKVDYMFKDEQAIKYIRVTLDINVSVI